MDKTNKLHMLKALAYDNDFHNVLNKNNREHRCSIYKTVEKNCCSWEKMLRCVWTITTFLQFQL